MNVSGPWIRRPVMTTLVMTALLVFGVVSYRKLPVADLPSVDYPTITVSASLAGASPETMAASVATPLEKQFSTIAGIDAITSSSQQGSTDITLQFDLDRDIDAAAADVQAAIAQAQRTLPSEMSAPPSYRKVDPSAAPILLYALTSPVLPLSALDEYGQTLIGQRLATVSGVAQVAVYGSQKYAVRIQVDPQALAARKIGIDEVVDAVRRNNVNLPTGILWGTDRAYAVQSDGQLRNAEAFRPLIITWRDGSPVRLADVARVVDSVQETKAAAWFNSDRGIVLAIQRQPGTNTVEVAERVRGVMAELQSALPPSVKVETIYDRSVSIRESVRDVKFTLYLTLGLVVTVIFLFLRNVSATAIPSLALPLSLVGTFAGMALLGYSLDNLSLMALTLAVGFVVDDAIVMLENIVRHQEMGKSRLQAALDGSAEIGFTIVSMTVSLVAVFIPILFLGGLVGRLFREFAVTLSLAILISGVVSLTLTPMLCSRYLKGGHGEGTKGVLGRIFGVTEGLYERAVRGYGRTLGWVMQRRAVTVGFSLLTLLATIWLFRVVPKGFIPSEDQGQLRGTIEALEGTSFESMLRHQRQAMAIVEADPNVAGFMSSIGGGRGQQNQGRLIIRLKDRDQRALSADQVATSLSRKLAAIPGVRAFVQNPPVLSIGGRSSKSLYQYTLQSADIDELYRAAQLLEARLDALPVLRDVTSDLQIKNPEVRVEIDRERAAATGVSMQAVQQALYDAFGARQVSTIYTDNNQYWVMLELLPEYQRDLGAMSLISVRAPNGTLVPLTALARVTETVGPLTVNHAGQLPAVTLSFNPAPGASLGDAVAAVERTALEVLPQGVSGAFAGTAQAFQEAQAGLLVLLALAIIVIYIVLGILYESFIHPLTILSGVLFAGFGALATLWIFQVDLSVYAFVGLVMLIGLVKKNAIMMIDFARDRELEGAAPAVAIHEAALVRFRPIMMTTMAALLGTLPIALGHGAGAESRRPLGLAVVGGLAFSQLVTLYVTPVIHTLLADLVAWWRARRAIAVLPRMGPEPTTPRAPEG
jgi:HAE1 family hydrophobic/amphiphilic exporter-1